MKNGNKKKNNIWLVFLLIIHLAPFKAIAFEVSPLTLELSNIGKNTSSQTIIKNPSDRSMPLEISVQRIEFTHDGKRKLIPAKDDILVFPPALLVPAGATQAVRLQWAGLEPLSESQSYFINISQPPLSLPQETSDGVKFLLSFNVLVHVAPDNTAAQVELLSDGEIIEYKGQDKIVARVRNNGNRYAYLGDYDLRITDANRKNLRYRAGELESLGEDVFLPPGVTRNIFIPSNGTKLTEPLRLELSRPGAR